MRPIVWKNHNKQDVHSGHAAWDRAVRCLSPGNVIDDGYCGSYVRPKATPFYPDGKTLAKPGQMRAFDLDHFFPRLPAAVRAYVELVTETEYALVYGFFHHQAGRPIVHGYLVTRAAAKGATDRNDPRSYKLLRKFYTGPTAKSRLVVDTASEYLSN